MKNPGRRLTRCGVVNRLSLARGVRIALALGVLGSAACLPRTEPYVSQVTLVSSQPLSATETEYVFELTVSNPLARDFQDVRVEAVPIAGSLAEAVDPKSEIGTLAANASVTSVDTITLVHPDKNGYEALDVSWRVSYYQPPPNRAPYASARWPQTVLVGDNVPLDGLQSSDPDGDALNYFWTFASMPAGSGAQLVNPHSERTSFVPDLPGTYFVQLVVDDGTLWSAQSVPVPITVIPIDPNSPTWVSIYPEPGQTDVPTNARISVVFSEWIEPASVNHETVFALGPDGFVEADLHVNANAVIIEPRTPLRAGSSYYVVFADNVSDRQGQGLGSILDWRFTTTGIVVP